MSKLSFTEELTGWGVFLPRGHLIGRLEESSLNGWMFLADFYGLTLSELDQIRHKLANLEQARINKLALQEKKDGND